VKRRSETCFTLRDYVCRRCRVLLLVLLVLPGLAGCGRTVHTATYATVAEARAAGAIERGWVPPIVPANAYELRAAYAIDGDDRWGLFNFRPEQADALRAVLHPEELPLSGTVMDIPPRIEWWPVLLRGRLDAERIQTTGLRAYRARSGRLVFAVNWDQGRAYYWSS
jgi:hypothetical protein